MAKSKEVIVLEIEQRAFQEACQRQVILGQQQEIAQGHHVHYGELFGDDDAVGARDRDAFCLERADHQRGEGVALAQQDEDITGADGASLRLQDFVGLQPAFDLPGDFLREPLADIVDTVIIEGGKGLGLVTLFLALGRPDFDKAGGVLAVGVVSNGAAAHGDALADLGIGEDEINSIKHGLG